MEKYQGVISKLGDAVESVRPSALESVRKHLCFKNGVLNKFNSILRGLRREEIWIVCDAMLGLPTGTNTDTVDVFILLVHYNAVIQCAMSDEGDNIHGDLVYAD